MLKIKRPGGYITKRCANCGIVTACWINMEYCWRCRKYKFLEKPERNWKKLTYKHLQRYAHGKVCRLIKDGLLAKLDGTVMCVDCGKPAEHYDHRDYRKPFKVEPVCRICNFKRGPAEPIAQKHEEIKNLFKFP